MNVNARNRDADSLIAKPAPHPRVYQRTASRSVALIVRVSSGVLQRARASERSDSRCGEGRATEFSVPVWLGLSRRKTLTIEDALTGPGDSAHYTMQGAPYGCRTKCINAQRLGA